ncbi:MAG: trypsin-like peptidase domain-containing protein [Candidatus Sungbacteria bacterium]|nr:trypsin-like peptidase domain-containing protein [Candidatus Sungbacteria bacterium]
MILRGVIAFLALFAIFTSPLWQKIIFNGAQPSKNSLIEDLVSHNLITELFFPKTTSTPNTKGTIADTQNYLPSKAPLIDKKTLPVSKEIPVPSKSQPPVSPQPKIVPPTPLLTSKEIYALLDTAIVQIVCKAGDNLYVSGSGVVVSDKGVVLTNAHVVENGKDCFVKTGNPAVISGKAEARFIGNTKNFITDTKIPKEDFAFMKITERTPNSMFAEPFKYLRLSYTYTPQSGDGFYLAAYASEFVGGGIPSGGQNLVFTIARVLDLYTVDGSGTDVAELEGNISTQEGASGSPVISPVDGSVIGLVFGQNKGEGGASVTSQRTEFAFLISYINRVLESTRNTTLADLIAEAGR